MKTKSMSSRKVHLAFGAAVMALLVVGAISYRGMVISSESDRLVRHTHEILENLQDLLLTLGSIESSDRGFVLTGRESYLESFHASILNAKQDEATIRNLTVDNSEQQRQLQILEGLDSQEIQFAERVIYLRRTMGLGTAKDAIQGGQGQGIMDEFQSVIRKMQGEELRLLALRDADAKRRSSQTRTALVFGTAIGVLVAVAAGWSGQRDSSKRELAEEALRGSEERLRMAIEAAEMGTWFWNIQRDEISWSAKFRTMFGLTSDAKLTYKQIFQVIHPDDRERLDQSVKKTIEVGVPYDIEYRVVWPDSSVHWIAAKGSVHRSPEGVAVSMQGIVMDVTERRRAQEALKNDEVRERRSAELKRSNDDLQQFAYIAAHDLQEPLRMVASYTQLLSKRYEGKLDADADEFISFAVGGAHRMQLLIGDLLAYCRVGTKGKELSETSSEAALEQALMNLQGAIQESGGVVTHDSLPTVIADGAQLAQLFQNVVGNAIKYRSAVLPRVHVSAQKNGGNEWIFSIRDNGIGIDSKYFEKVFVMFQRLHGREEFSGTGIGLTLCKKIAERHGGRMWVESAPGKGSTFYLALPERG
jgi:PAS domain S-box-containing protein